MKNILSILGFVGLFINSAHSQTQFIDKYENLVVREMNTTATSDQGWVSVADVMVDSTTKKLAVIKFDMCGDLEWSNFYSADNIEFHHGEIIQNISSGYHLVCSDSDLSKGPTGAYMLNLDQNGNVMSAINYADEGTMIHGYSIGPDLAIHDTTKVLTEYESDNGNKGLALFEGTDVVWSKSYNGLTNMPSPMAIEPLNDSMIFVTNTFQVAMLDGKGEVLWSMKNDSVVIWPEVAFLDDNTVGILVSPLVLDSTERADGRRYIHLVTFPQGTPNPVMHEGTLKMSQLFPELHAVDQNFVMISIDSLPDIEAYAQTYTIYDADGALMEQKYLSDFLQNGPVETMPFIGFDSGEGAAFISYASSDSSIYFGKLAHSLEVVDPMACMTNTYDTVRNELLDWWEDINVTIDSIETSVDSIEIVVAQMDTLIMVRECENEIPDGMVMQAICRGDSIFIGGEWIKEEGTYMDTMVICEEEIITTYEITFYELVDENFAFSKCPDDTITINGIDVVNDTTLVFPFELCGVMLDSIIDIVNLEQEPPRELVGRTCKGDTIRHFDPVNGALLITENTSFTVTVPDNRCPGFFTTTTYTYTFGSGEDQLKELFPNAFTPNNDGMNDMFIMKQDTSMDLTIEKYEMRVFNRWGQEVFSSSDPNEGWDGRHDGGDPLSEVYIFSVQLAGRLDNCVINDMITGDVTLIR